MAAESGAFLREGRRSPTWRPAVGPRQLGAPPRRQQRPKRARSRSKRRLRGVGCNLGKTRHMTHVRASFPSPRRPEEATRVP
eukprot:5803407-Alexandrium_andersonii.AAC.1